MSGVATAFVVVVAAVVVAVDEDWVVVGCGFVVSVALLRRR